MRTIREAFGRRVPLVLLLIALAARALFFGLDPHPDYASGLTGRQGEVARNIVDHGRWFEANRTAARLVAKEQRQTDSLIDPEDFDYSEADRRAKYQPELVVTVGPALVLAATWKLTGSERFIWLQLIQVVLGALLTLVVCWIALRLFGRPRTALIAGLLWALSPGISFLASVPIYDTGAVYATVAIAALYLWARERRDALLPLAAVGVAIGAATLFRQGVVFLILAFALYEVLTARTLRPGLKTLGILSLSCAVALVPWTIRSLNEFGELRPVNGVSGQVLWQGLGDDTATFGAYNDDKKTFRQVHAVRPELEYGTPEYDNYLRKMATEAIADHPAAWLKVLATRVGKATVGSAAPWPQDAADSWRESGQGKVGFAISHPLSGLLLAIAVALDPALFLAALVATVLLWRRTDRHFRTSAVFLWAVYATVLIVPIFVSGAKWRYLAPGLFVLFILSARGLDELLPSAQGHGARSTRRSTNEHETRESRSIGRRPEAGSGQIMDVG